MALSNAQRQARHRERMRMKLAAYHEAEPPIVQPSPPSGADGSLRNEETLHAESLLDVIRGRFEDGMIELLNQGDHASDPCAAVSEPRQAAIDRFAALGREGQWRLLMDGLCEAGHRAALRIVEDCHREWNRDHPRPPEPPPEPQALPLKQRRVRQHRYVTGRS